jgi:glycolate oxidase FAD binding subunit
MIQQSETTVFRPGVARQAVTAVAERVRVASENGIPMRIEGANTWPAGGMLVNATEVLSSAPLDGIIDYVPGDLTITAGAGTPLSKIESAAAANDQWLGLDPFGSDAGTIGATIATASYGPLATAFGTPRDLVLGIEAVTGAGRVIRAGGRVVKNVAGFDLVRLFTGSKGTLGMITEATLRLRGRPVRDETVAIALGDGAGGIRSLVAALRSWPFTPMAVQVVDPSCAAALGLRSSTTVLLRLGGNPRSVTSQRKLAAAVGKAANVDPAIWTKLRGLEKQTDAVLRVSGLPAAFPEHWDVARDLAETGFITGMPGRGVVRCVFREADPARMTQIRARARTASFIFESLPSTNAWHSLTVEHDAGSLDSRIRAAFDPAGIMNPGILRRTR